jgi:hypothetical protein
MTEFVYVKPAFEGGRIRMPDRDSKVMPAEGHTVPRIDFYERLIIAGDLVITDDPNAPKPAAHPDAHKDKLAAPKHG